MDLETEGVLLIPARGGSRGIKQKNLQKVHGVPLVIRALNHAIYMRNYANLKICISSDDTEILELCSSHLKILEIKFSENLDVNFPVFLHQRSKKLSSSKSLTKDLIKDLTFSFKRLEKEFGYWCILQPTTPFRSRKDLKKAALLASNLRENNCVVSVECVNEFHPSRMYSIIQKKLEPLTLNGYLARRQDLSEIYIRDGGFYLLPNIMAKQGLVYNESPSYFERQMPWSINIDTPYSLLLSQNLPTEQVSADPNNELYKSL
jgi:CMP-N,N'-diacetyllegionaminic acid synthase